MFFLFFWVLRSVCFLFLIVFIFSFHFFHVFHRTSPAPTSLHKTPLPDPFRQTPVRRTSVRWTPSAGPPKISLFFPLPAWNFTLCALSGRLLVWISVVFLKASPLATRELCVGWQRELMRERKPVFLDPNAGWSWAQQFSVENSPPSWRRWRRYPHRCPASRLSPRNQERHPRGRWYGRSGCQDVQAHCWAPTPGARQTGIPHVGTFDRPHKVRPLTGCCGMKTEAVAPVFDSLKVGDTPWSRLLRTRTGADQTECRSMGGWDTIARNFRRLEDSAYCEQQHERFSCLEEKFASDPCSFVDCSIETGSSHVSRFGTVSSSMLAGSSGITCFLAAVWTHRSFLLFQFFWTYCTIMLLVFHGCGTYAGYTAAGKHRLVYDQGSPRSSSTLVSCGLFDAEGCWQCWKSHEARCWTRRSVERQACCGLFPCFFRKPLNVKSVIVIVSSVRDWVGPVYGRVVVQVSSGGRDKFVSPWGTPVLRDSEDVRRAVRGFRWSLADEQETLSQQASLECNILCGHGRVCGPGGACNSPSERLQIHRSVLARSQGWSEESRMKLSEWVSDWTAKFEIARTYLSITAWSSVMGLGGPRGVSRGAFAKRRRVKPHPLCTDLQHFCVGVRRRSFQCSWRPGWSGAGHQVHGARGKAEVPPPRCREVVGRHTGWRNNHPGLFDGTTGILANRRTRIRD